MTDWFRFNAEDHGDWKRMIDVDSYAFERTLLAVGWRFFYITPPIEHRALGRADVSSGHASSTDEINANRGDIRLQRPGDSRGADATLPGSAL